MDTKIHSTHACMLTRVVLTKARASCVYDYAKACVASEDRALNRDDGGLLPDAYLHLVRKKAAN